MKIKVREITLSSNGKLAEVFQDRLIGLMFKSEMKGYDSLLIKKCNSIHTFFMRFNIDVIFVDKNLKILKIYRELRPWRMTTMVWRATQVLELNGGAVPKEVIVGDILDICTS